MRSNAWTAVFSSTQITTARSGGFMYNATMSRTLSTKSGSSDSLKVSSCHGLRPNAFQIRLTVGWDIPNDLASPRVDQWVAS